MAKVMKVVITAAAIRQKDRNRIVTLDRQGVTNPAGLKAEKTFLKIGRSNNKQGCN